MCSHTFLLWPDLQASLFRMHQICCVSSEHVGSKTGESGVLGKHSTYWLRLFWDSWRSWTNASSFYLDTFSGVGRECSEKHSMYPWCCLSIKSLSWEPSRNILLVILGAAAFQIAWTWHGEPLIKTVTSALLLAWKSQVIKKMYCM